jgi:hypothetical protein
MSGYEFLLGHSCTIGGQPGTCGVQFGGWTGGGGSTAGGWTHFPGDGRGLWSATINYIGTASFGDGTNPHSVTVIGGNYDVLFKTPVRNVFGAVTTGTVTWPPTSSSDVGCGIGVASVLIYLTGGASSFQGCLHDLPAGSVIPPQIWGELNP